MYAVLIPYVKTESGDALLLEVRSQKVRQPGEVCFPGGRIESGETAAEAAVRETCEELGISSDLIEIISEHESIVMGDGRNIYPVSANLHLGSIEELTISDAEVEEVFLLPIAWLEENELIHYDLADTADEELPQKLRLYLSHYGEYRNTGETDYIEFEGHGIWGLTARIIKLMIYGKNDRV